MQRFYAGRTFVRDHKPDRLGFRSAASRQRAGRTLRGVAQRTSHQSLGGQGGALIFNARPSVCAAKAYKVRRVAWFFVEIRLAYEIFAWWFGVPNGLFALTQLVLGNHFKSGQRLSLQNRPMGGTRNLDLLSCHTLFRQV